jgi:hypothetical protein
MHRLLLLFVSLLPAFGGVADVRRAFADPPPDSRIMMRWWWFGPSVSKAQLEREMRTMKEGGIGGFEVQPVYPLQLEGNVPFLSDEFLDALKFTAGKARELGLRFDLTLGSGWPFGGPQIPLEQAAGRLRIERMPPGSELPRLREGESLVGSFAGTRDVVHFIASHTRQMVKRPSMGAEGFVLDHYSREATDRYLSTVGERLLKPLAGLMPYAIFCDSLEVFGSDWTPALLSEFQKRRGYDLKPLLPALNDDAHPGAAGIRHDWGKTLTELAEERFLAPLHEWSRARGTLFRIQGYGIPPAVVSSNVHADISEGEGSQWKVVRASRWASSANHIFKRPVTTSETWTWLHSPVFRATPLDVKAEADIHFLQGINQLIGHGWPYTAEGVEYPGWRFYASGVFNEKNPWWIVMPDVSRYLQRISYLLRQGKPANDVALYLPSATAWSQFKPGHVHMIEQMREHVGPDVMPQILDSGYGLDFVDDRAIAELARVEAGRLSIGDGRYRAVVLPAAEIVPVGVMRKLEQFAKAGGIVIATRQLPSSAPGYKATQQETAQVGAIASRILRRAVPDRELGAALRAAFAPDFALPSLNPDIGFIHRATADSDIYFVANTGNTPLVTEATFRVTGREPEVWNAITGEAAGVPVIRRAGGRITVPLELEPYGSRVFVFSPGAKAAPPTMAPGSTIALDGEWNVRFGDRTATYPALKSWTDDESTRHYSGTAAYSKSFEIPNGLLNNGARVRLDLGEGTPLTKPVVDPSMRSGPGMRAWFDSPVREAAVVYINGKKAGSMWCPPYQLDVTRLLKAGRNELRIEVANLALNHMAGRPLPDYKELRAKFGNRFDPQDMDGVKPIPSGLMGPIRLLVLNAKLSSRDYRKGTTSIASVFEGSTRTHSK